MEFNRAELLETLDVAKLAIDSREFIPILSHFCFNKKYVTTYNDRIGIRIALKTNFSVALQAETLLKLVNSVSSEVVQVGFADKSVYFKSGAVRKGVRARLPYMNEEDFFFKWPNMKRLDLQKLDAGTAETFFRGLQLCLSSVGEQDPTQMGVTLTSKKGGMLLHSTNTKSISRFFFKNSVTSFKDDILPTDFCKALIKGWSVYGSEDVSIAKDRDSVLVRFGSHCVMYAKLISNKDPLNFEKVIKEYVPAGFKKEMQKWHEDFPEALQRAQIMLRADLDDLCRMHVDRALITIETKGPTGKLRSSAEFDDIVCKEDNRHSFSADIGLMLKAVENTSHLYVAKKCLVFSDGNYMHLVSKVMDV